MNMKSDFNFFNSRQNLIGKDSVLALYVNRVLCHFLIFILLYYRVNVVSVVSVLLLFVHSYRLLVRGNRLLRTLSVFLVPPAYVVCLY